VSKTDLSGVFQKSIVWTHTLYRTQVDKNRQYRT